MKNYNLQRHSRNLSISPKSLGVACLFIMSVLVVGGCGESQPTVVEFSKEDADAAKQRYKASVEKAHGTPGEKGAR